MNELFFHECRAAGLVFKTSNDWFKWLTENSYDIKKPVAEHEGFKYNIYDVCTNPHVIGYDVDGVNSVRQLGMEGNDRQYTVRLDMGLQHSEREALVRQPGSLPEQIRHSQHLLR